MDRDAFKKMWKSKKGCALTPEESSTVDTMTVRELAKIFDLVEEEKDWEEEIRQIKERRAEAERRRAEGEIVELEEEGLPIECEGESGRALGNSPSSPQVEEIDEDEAKGPLPQARINQEQDWGEAVAAPVPTEVLDEWGLPIPSGQAAPVKVAEVPQPEQEPQTNSWGFDNTQVASTGDVQEEVTVPEECEFIDSTAPHSEPVAEPAKVKEAWGFTDTPAPHVEEESTEDSWGFTAPAPAREAESIDKAEPAWGFSAPSETVAQPEVPSQPTQDAWGFTSTPTPIPSSAPEPVTDAKLNPAVQWEVIMQQSMAARDAKEQADLALARSAARDHIQEFERARKEKAEETRQRNLKAEESFREHRDSLFSSERQWEKVASIIDLKDKAKLGRMRSLLSCLKNE